MGDSRARVGRLAQQDDWTRGRLSHGDACRDQNLSGSKLFFEHAPGFEGISARAILMHQKSPSSKQTLLVFRV